MDHPASFTSALFLLVVATGHLCRIAFSVQIVADGLVIPIWLSVPGVMIPAVLAYWLLKERRIAVR